MGIQQDEVVQRLQSMDNYEFERFIAELWENRGWDTQVTAKSNDLGVDVVATQSVPYHEKELIQAKRYQRGNRVGSPELQQYSSLLQQEKDADKVIVVCTSGFTDSALAVADDTNVKCIDGVSLAEMVSQQDAFELLRKYSEPTEGTSPTSTSQNTDSETHTNHSENEAKKTVIGHGKDIAIELLGLERVDTSFSGQGALDETVRIDGVMVALKIFSTGNEATIDSSSNNFVLKDDHDNSYSAALLPNDEFPDSWKPFGMEMIRLNPGESANCVVGASLPNDTKISKIVFEARRERILTDARTIELNLNYKTREALSQLPPELRRTI